MENAISPYKKYLVALKEFKAAEIEYEKARSILEETNQELEGSDVSIKNQEMRLKMLQEPRYLHRSSQPKKS